MRSYLILNGNNSLNIRGLLIQNLPPISKPKIRTQIETIDGRDGDNVTYLGYSSYEKSFQIGLYDNFDIDEIIAFFNTSGTVIFSNEPDKYYNYQIVEQIDFNKLIRFRTATVKMHVQPFKYSAEDNSKEFNFDTSNKFNFNNWYSNRSALSVSSGNFSITETSLTLNGMGQILLGTFSTATSPNQADITTIETFGAEISPNTEYTFSATTNGDGEVWILYYDEDYKYLTRYRGVISENGYNSFKFTTPTNAKYICLKVSCNDTSFSLTNMAIQLETEAKFEIYNAGNYFSKPTLIITGSGNIGVTLNGIQLFQIALGDIGSITIDTTQMEAYNGTTLLNRLVTGDYDNFKLNIGKNNILFNGNVTETEIQNYSRWV